MRSLLKTLGFLHHHNSLFCVFCVLHLFQIWVGLFLFRFSVLFSCTLFLTCTLLSETLQLLYHIMLRHPSRLVAVPVMLSYTETELFRYLFWHLEMHMVSSSVDLVAFMLSIFSCIFFNPLLRPHFSLHLELYLRVLISSLSKNQDRKSVV